MITKHERHIFLHVVRDGVNIYLFFISVFVSITVFLNNSSNLLHDEMTIIPTQIVEYDGYFYFICFYFEFQITVLMSRTSIFTSYMAAISNSYISFVIFFITYMTFISFLVFFFIIFSHSQWFIKMLIHCCFTIFDFF